MMDIIEKPLETLVSRRSLISGGAGLLAGLAAPVWARNEPSRASDFWKRPRTIRLAHVSGERIEATYWSDGEMIPNAWQELSWVLRDRVDQKAVFMQPVLLDILYGVSGWLDYYGIKDPMIATSGYRTHSRNLRIEGAAKDSEHTKAGATDIRHPSVPTEQFARFGIWLSGGGVGWYPGKGFTHVDRGRLRYWRG